MSDRFKWRGMSFNLSDSLPVNEHESDPEIIKSGRAAINRIIEAGFEGVAVKNVHDKDSGQRFGTLLIDVSTIEGHAAAGILNSLSTASEPFDPNFVLNLITFEYMCLGLPFPTKFRKRKGNRP